MQRRKTHSPQQRATSLAATTRPVSRELPKLTAGELLADPDRLMDDHELSIVQRRSRSRIQKDRLTKQGPPFIRVGKFIRYRAGDVRDWLRSHTVQTASA